MPPPYPWPAIHGMTPSWTGSGFRLGDLSTPVLNYQPGDSGWSESLTDLHENAAGEGTHPIDVASRRHARAALTRHLGGRSAESLTLLEAGCSSGYLLQELTVDWPHSLVIGSDFIEGPLQRLAARRPDVPLLRFDLVQCPLPSASVDAVVLLNVLEHIEDDRGAAAQVYRVLKPGGVAVIEVPAGPGLYDAYDKHLQHFRRYRLRDLCGLLAQAGFAIADRTHLGFFVYPAFAAVKRRNRRLLDAPAHVQQQVVEQNIRASSGAGGALGLAMAMERWAGQWVKYPIGIRCVVTATKA